MLHGLKRADRSAERPALKGIGDGHVQAALGTADLFCRKPDTATCGMFEERFGRPAAGEISIAGCSARTVDA